MIARQLCCSALKVARGRPISFHLLHIAQEFGFERLAEPQNEQLARLVHFGCVKVPPLVLPRYKR
jgi:hypothetical protein